MIKNGLFTEEGRLIYYKDGRPYHAGVVKVDGEIYYISSHGRAIKGEHVVHSEMTNGLLKRGTYTFGEDYKLIKNSYVAPKKRKQRSRSLLRKWKQWGPLLGTSLGILVIVLGAYYCITELNITMSRCSSSEAVHSSTAAQTETMDVFASEETSHLRLPEFDGKVLLCSQAVKGMYDGQTTVEAAVDAGNAYIPLAFEYDFGDLDGTLLVYEKDAPETARYFDLEAKYTSIAIDNLKTGTAYGYEVTVDGETYEGSFETESSPRFLSIPGVSNVRDIGGYENADGVMVKQGMIIRGSELDGLSVASYFMEPGAEEQVQETFGFAYDFDLRGASIYAGVYQSRLGEDVEHKFYGAPQYGEIFSRGYQPALREIFTDLAKPENYPMYLHCTHGADRTGTIVFLLQGVLGMTEQDMVNEYQMTGFTTRSYRNSDKMKVVIAGFEGYAGDTLSEKIVSFLTQTVGITEGEIQSIRSIMLEQ